MGSTLVRRGSNHLRQLGVALQAHHAARQRLPAGARMHVRQGTKSIGWHVEALPYLEQQPLYERIAPDADGGARSFASNVVVPVYVCPSATPPRSCAKASVDRSAEKNQKTGTDAMSAPLTASTGRAPKRA